MFMLSFNFVIVCGLFVSVPSQDMDLQHQMLWSFCACLKPRHGFTTSNVVVFLCLFQAKTWIYNIKCCCLFVPVPSQDMDLQHQTLLSFCARSKPRHGFTTSNVVVFLCLSQAKTWIYNIKRCCLFVPVRSQDMDLQHQMLLSFLCSMI